MSATTPYDLIGGHEPVLGLAKAFYDHMEAHEPALTAVHEQDAPGVIAEGTRQRFGLFLIGWLGGPQTYMERHGHPRLRMRHRHVPIESEMRDAWLRCMQAAMDAQGIEGELRTFLNARFAHVADFLRNRPDPPG